VEKSWADRAVDQIKVTITALPDFPVPEPSPSPSPGEVPDFGEGSA
jgi:hypothetical protein